MRLAPFLAFVALVAASIALAIIRVAADFDDMIGAEDFGDTDRYTTDPATWPRAIR